MFQGTKDLSPLSPLSQFLRASVAATAIALIGASAVAGPLAMKALQRCGRCLCTRGARGSAAG